MIGKLSDGIFLGLRLQKAPLGFCFFFSTCMKVIRDSALILGLSSGSTRTIGTSQHAPAQARVLGSLSERLAILNSTRPQTQGLVNCLVCSPNQTTRPYYLSLPCQTNTYHDDITGPKSSLCLCDRVISNTSVWCFDCPDRHSRICCGSVTL